MNTELNLHPAIQGTPGFFKTAAALSLVPNGFTCIRKQWLSCSFEQFSIFYSDNANIRNFGIKYLSLKVKLKMLPSD